MARSFFSASVRGFAVISLFAAAAVIAPAHAEYEQQAAATKAFAEKAFAFYKANGMETAKSAFLTPKAWVLGPDQWNLHVSAVDADQTVWADSAYPEVVGLSYKDINDLDGVALSETVMKGLDKSPNGAAVQVRFGNRVTNAVAHAEGYCLKGDAGTVLCGWSQSQ